MKAFFEKINRALPKSLAVRIILVVMLIVGVVGAVYAFRLLRAFSAQGADQIALKDTIDTTSGTTNNAATESAPSADPVIEMPKADDVMMAAQPWDGKTRVNILIMGVDYREGEEGQIPKSDTMMLLTLDPVYNTVGIVSIPRDMWVNIPNHGYYKINMAYYFGELEKLPGGGPAMAAKTVEEFLGITVHFYAMVDFDAFVKFVDHAGGIKVTITEPFVCDRRGKWNTGTLEPGDWSLDGEWALCYIRSRKTSGGDFDRAMRQQQAIISLRDRILEFDRLTYLITNAPKIYADIASEVQTNINFDQILSLGLKVMEIPRENIKTVVINNEYVTLETAPDGGAILKPIPDKIRLLRDEVFTSGILAGPAALGDDLLTLLKAEGARVSIRNGSYLGGMAASTAQYLRDQGVNVVEELEGADYTVYTQIYIYGSKPYAIKYLADLMHVTFATIYYKYDPNAAIDVVVVLGDDWANNNPIGGN